MFLIASPRPPEPDASGGPVPTERASRAGRVMAVTADSEVTAELPGDHDGYGSHSPLGHRAGGTNGTGHDDSCDHGDHSDHAGHGGLGAITVRSTPAHRVTATTLVPAIAEAPGGRRMPRDDHGSGPPRESPWPVT
jgi:hypothetical protein